MSVVKLDGLAGPMARTLQGVVIHDNVERAYRIFRHRTIVGYEYLQFKINIVRCRNPSLNGALEQVNIRAVESPKGRHVAASSSAPRSVHVGRERHIHVIQELVAYVIDVECRLDSVND